MNRDRGTHKGAKGRPPRVYKVTTPDGDVQKFTGAALVARVLGVKKQTVYNRSSSGKTVRGCLVERYIKA